MGQLELSLRAYVKVLKVARTIADLDRRDRVGVPHVAEAIQYRVLDRDGERPRPRPAAAIAAPRPRAAPPSKER
jgi:hypothetical protein